MPLRIEPEVPSELSRPLRAAALTAAVVSAAWWLRSRYRDRYAARLHRALVDLLLNSMSAGDPITERHSRRVANLTDVLAATYPMTGEDKARLRIASLLHDMGKIDDRFFPILHSCEPLSEEQRKQIRQHPHESAHILMPMERIHPGIMRIVESHHERWDGKGYPRCLAGEEIPLEARIISVADVFDALTQPRPYHEPRSIREALAEIARSAGTKFDPEVVARMRTPRVLRRWTEIARGGRENEERVQNGPDPQRAQG